MIFVSLGSQKFQFNRLLMEIDYLIEDGTILEEVIAQTGYSTYEPKNYKSIPFMSKPDFDQYVEDCRILITHGGTGAIVGALKKNKKVIAVPRLAKYGEHVDDHQTQIVDVFRQKGMICGCKVEGLSQALREAEVINPTPFVSNTDHFIAFIDEYIEKNATKNKHSGGERE